MTKFYQISTQDGNKIDLTLNLGALAELSKSRKDLSDRYFELYKKMQGKNAGLNEVEMGEVLYIAYACAHVGEDISLDDIAEQAMVSKSSPGYSAGPFQSLRPGL